MRVCTLKREGGGGILCISAAGLITSKQQTKQDIGINGAPCAQATTWDTTVPERERQLLVFHTQPTRTVMSRR